LIKQQARAAWVLADVKARFRSIEALEQFLRAENARIAAETADQPPVAH
jgi:hypothetical protein